MPDKQTTELSERVADLELAVKSLALAVFTLQGEIYALARDSISQKSMKSGNSTKAEARRFFKRARFYREADLINAEADDAGAVASLADELISPHAEDEQDDEE